MDILYFVQSSPSEVPSSIAVSESTPHVSVDITSTESDQHPTEEVPVQVDALSQASLPADLPTHPMVTRSKVGVIQPNPKYRLCKSNSRLWNLITISDLYPGHLI